MRLIPNYGRSDSATGFHNLLMIFLRALPSILAPHATPYDQTFRKHGSGIKNSGIDINGTPGKTAEYFGKDALPLPPGELRPMMPLT